MTTREQVEYLDGILREYGLGFKYYSFMVGFAEVYTSLCVAWRDETGKNYLPWSECPDDRLDRYLKSFLNTLKYTDRFKLILVRNPLFHTPENVELSFPPFDNVQELKMKMELGAKITVNMK